MKYVFLILVSLAFSSCNGQEVQHALNITVIDEMGNGLPESEIKLIGLDTTLVSKTDFDGNLEVSSLSKGNYQINISSVGHFQLKNYQIQLVENEQLTFKMKAIELKQANVEWQGGWVTFESEDGKIISVKSKE